MARGTIAWRCWICRKNTTKETCHHRGGKYYISYCLGKEQKWEPIGRNKKEAEHRLTQVMTELQQGTFRLPKPILFREFSEQWLKDYAEGVLKPLTLRLYRLLVRVHLNRTFGELLLTDITSQRVYRFLTELVSEKGRSPRTRNYLLFLLKMMLKHARQWGYLKENPSEGIKPLREERAEMSFLHPDEIPLLLKHADEPYRALFLTAIFTGIAKGTFPRSSAHLHHAADRPGRKHQVHPVPTGTCLHRDDHGPIRPSSS